MMAAAGLWLRRGGMGLVLVSSVVVVLVAVFSRNHWVDHLDIALPWANGSTVLLSPLAGALAAFTVWRGYPRDLQALTRTTPRGTRTVFHLAAAVWLTASFAWLLGVVAAIAGVWVAGGSLVARDPWVLVAGPVALFPAVMMGTLAAVAVRGLAVAPLVGVLIYVIIVWTYPMPVPALMTVRSGTGTWIGLRPLPGIVITSILLNVLVGVVLAYGAWRLAAVRLRRLVSSDVVGVLALAGVVVVLVTAPQRETLDTHYLEPPEYACAGDAPAACVSQAGPLDPEAVATQLGEAHRALADTGLDLPTRYEEDGEAYSGVILLTEPTVDGRLSGFDLAMSLTRPTRCEAYSGDLPPEEALQAQRVLGHWVDWVVRLEADPTSWRAVFGDAQPADVERWSTAAHRALAACDLDAAVLRERPDVAAGDRW